MTTPPGFRERFGLAGDCKVVLYVGGEGPRKNLPRLLRAFARVKAALPGVKLIKAGAADLPAWHDRLLTLRSELALDDDVLFVNHLPEEDLVAFYNLADLFVFPSLYEGFGLPPLEAMACGAPVVCSDAASVPEVVGDAALTVDPHSVEELAAAMLRVLTEPDLREELRQKGLAQSQRFSWERTAQETIAIYRKFGA
jgi:glycosyltransferase involved in cell wall biosynthesis